MVRSTGADRLFIYHERTKHSPSSLRRRVHSLDWANQPDPFRRYRGAPFFPLPKEPLPEVPTFTALAENLLPPLEINALRIGQLMYSSMAISAWKLDRATGSRYSLRVNPSSGNLHPTETYLAIRKIPGLEDGLYHYFVPEHGLKQRRQGPSVELLASRLQMEWIAEARLVILLTSIFWRESWKYRERGYRYCLLDLGHAAMSLLAAANSLGLKAACLGHFPDRELAAFLGVDPLSEGPMMLMVLYPGIKEPRPAGDGDKEKVIPIGPLQGEPNRLSAEETSYPLLQEMHESTILEPGVDLPFQDRPAPGTREGGIPLVKGAFRDLPLRQTARRRRSALDFDPRASMTSEELGSLLGHALPFGETDYRSNFSTGGAGGSLITLYLYVHRVEGLRPGIYRYRGEDRRLILLREGDQRSMAAYLSLEQSLAGNGCVAFSMAADLERASRAFGDRGYRYAHFDAGMIGQKLYLGAEALGFNGTGIGAFYDDEVHQHLSLRPEAGQVIYHFAVGRAIPDHRLVRMDTEMESS